VKKFLIGLFSLAILLSFVQSCQKLDTTDLGIGLIPVVDNVNTFDTTLEVIAANRPMPNGDSTSISRSESHALGVMVDPEFGTTSANIYFEILPPTSGVYPFGNRDSSRTIDSVVLSLSYQGLYGDSMSIQNITVYEIGESANFDDSLYRTDAQDIAVVPTPLGQRQVQFTTLNDEVSYRQGKDSAIIKQTNQLRLRLNNSLGVRLANYDTAQYKNDTTFRRAFRGLAIKADAVSSTSKRALAYFNISDVAKTRLTVYYRVANNGAMDTAFTDFTYRATQSGKNPQFIANRSANLIKRDIAGTNYSNALTGLQQDKIYLQSTPGSYASVHVPGLKTLTNRLIHKAELIIEQIPSADDNVFTTPLLFLDLMDSANNRFISIQNDFIIDQQQAYNTNEFGGVIRNNAYSFDISRHVQGIVSRKNKVYTFRLYAPYVISPYYAIPGTDPNTITSTPVPLQVNRYIAAGRLVAGGATHSTRKMRVRIIYSRI
jgi:hypothetical protein